MTPGLHLLVTLLAAAVCLAMLAWRYPMLTGTTLRAAWYWCLLALIALMLGSIAAVRGQFDVAAASHVRYAAAITMFCPLMALLGAKRPQDRAWQFIVLSLWVVLMLPSGEALLHRPNAPLQLHGARQWFLAILVAIGLFNALPTRFWLASLLASAAQVLLLGPFLPWLDLRADAWLFQSPQAYSLAMVLLAIGAVLRAAGVPAPRTGVDPLDRLWLDFRDRFGAVWALRVAERMNAASQMYGWGIRLSWRGFVRHDAEPLTGLPSEVRQAAEKSFRSLLRRFVSPAWIAAKLRPRHQNERAPAES